jgi:hypothetical protein
MHTETRAASRDNCSGREANRMIFLRGIIDPCERGLFVRRHAADGA